MKIIFEGNHWFPFRSSRPEVFCKKGVIKFCLRPATLLKKRLWRRCFPVNFAKFLKTVFFHRTPQCSKLFFGSKIDDLKFQFSSLVDSTITSDIPILSHWSSATNTFIISTHSMFNSFMTKFPKNSKNSFYMIVASLIKKLISWVLRWSCLKLSYK